MSYKTFMIGGCVYDVLRRAIEPSCDREEQRLAMAIDSGNMPWLVGNLFSARLVGAWFHGLVGLVGLAGQVGLVDHHWQW